MVESILHSILSTIWTNFLVQYGIAGVILAACVALFWFVPFTRARELAVIVAVLDLVFMFGAPKIYMEGIAYERSQWDAANKAAEKRAADARVAAEREVPALAPAPVADGLATPAPGLPDRTSPPAAPANTSAIGRVIGHIIHPSRKPAAAPGGVQLDRYDRDK